MPVTAGATFAPVFASVAATVAPKVTVPADGGVQVQEYSRLVPPAIACAPAGAAAVQLPAAAGATVGVTDAFRRTWQLANQGVSRFDEQGADVLSVALEAKSPLGALKLLTPEIREYHGRGGEHIENTVSRRQSTGAITQTLRVLLVGADSLDVASVRVTFLPLPILWPAGIALLALSVLLTGGKTSKEHLTE
jgi:hypothetical protein